MSAWFPIPTNEEAWNALPAALQGQGEPLPPWARILARSLPRGTAALLELDTAHRTQNSLEPKLRARLRWVAASGQRLRICARTALQDLNVGRRSELDEMCPHSATGKGAG